MIKDIIKPIIMIYEKLKWKKKRVKFHSKSFAFYNNEFEGNNSIGQGSIVHYTIMGYGTYICCNNELINCRIGRFCSLGSNIRIVEGSHPSNTYVSTHPAFFSLAKQAGFTYVKNTKFLEHKLVEEGYSVVIGNDVWIGDNVLILGGIKIGDGAIIAAGAVVTKDVSPYAIMGGVPAKVLKYRFSEDLIIKLKKVVWWEKDIKWIEKNAELFDDVQKVLEVICAESDSEKEVHFEKNCV